MAHNFGERATEYSPKQGKEVNVWRSPKYEMSKAKAIEMIDCGKYGLSDGDFWILMNETKNGSMAYTGLIISHNGCLKINDAMDSKFVPSCVTENQSGYGGSLVFTYRNDDQGIYEVGEVSSSNCKNAYPYAMAFKRLFDRVVLKLSKLAYAGVYSESEADEFREPITEKTSKQDSKAQQEGFSDLSQPIGVNTAKVLAAMIKKYEERTKKSINTEALCEKYGVSALKDLTGEAYAKIVKQLNE